MLISIEDLMFIYLPRILLAIFCGSLIGLERELKDKPAGIKTYMLICTGAALFTIVGLIFSDYLDPNNESSRIAAQIVTGVGFLGAGTIIFARGHVKGLTSAAAIWLSAAVGMSIGVGMYLFAVIVTLLCILSLILLGKIEERLGMKGRKSYDITIKLSDQKHVDKLLTIVHRSSGKCRITEIERSEDLTTIKMTCNFTAREMNGFQSMISKIPGELLFRIED